MNTSFDESYDVVVAGFGLAGGIAALNAAQAGAKTLLIEKSPVPGGLSICSYGAVRSARDPEQAFNYLKATNAGAHPMTCCACWRAECASSNATCAILARSTMR